MRFHTGYIGLPPEIQQVFNMNEIMKCTFNSLGLLCQKLDTPLCHIGVIYVIKGAPVLYKPRNKHKRKWIELKIHWSECSTPKAPS